MDFYQIVRMNKNKSIQKNQKIKLSRKLRHYLAYYVTSSYIVKYKNDTEYERWRLNKIKIKKKNR